MIYKSFIRPFLFLKKTETIHSFVARTLKGGYYLLPLSRKYLVYNSPRLVNNVAGLLFKGPVGMAAGFDKTGELYPALSEIGFNFVECGTFTNMVQDGNPLPRLFRLVKEQALINRMGFNNPGASNVAQIFKKQNHKVICGINLGKSKITPLSGVVEDYISSLRKLLPFANYIAINISSPNTPGLLKLQKETKLLYDLLSSIKNEIGNYTKKVQKINIPLFIKLSSDINFRELDEILSILIRTKVDGVILSNTSIDQSSIKPHLRREGGLSGKPIQQKSTKLIRHCFKEMGSKLAIIGVGGIDSGQTALEKILAGASLIQFYTGYIYQGPRLPYIINQYIDNFLKGENLCIKDIVGQERMF